MALNITQQEVNIIRELCDDYMNHDILPIFYHWMEYKRRMEIFQYLKKSGLRGKQIVDWLRAPAPHGFAGRPMEMAKHILMKIDRDVTVRPIVLGKDFGS